jgi:hypothetical protein
MAIVEKNLQHDDDQHGSDHCREDLAQRGVRLCRLLDRSAHLDAIAGRKGCDQRLEGLHDLVGNLRRLGRLVYVRAERNDGRAIAPFQHGLFKTDFRMADLVEWNLPAVPAHQREIRQPCRIEPLVASAACYDRDIADVLANLRDGDAGQQELELLADFRWR